MISPKKCVKTKIDSNGPFKTFIHFLVMYINYMNSCPSYTIFKVVWVSFAILDCKKKQKIKGQVFFNQAQV